MRRIKRLSRNAEDVHGSARWATEKDIQRTGLLDARKGAYVGGWSNPHDGAVHYLRHDGPEHILAFAPTRSGKGVGLVIPTLLTWSESTVVYDNSLFWNYSLGNQILALIQANRRGLALGPIASFNRWKELGRHVKRGEKAITLCMPVTCKRTVTERNAEGNEIESEITFKRFVFKRNWFMLAQTDGAEYQMPAIPAWDRARSLHTLGVEEIPFEMLNGNCQGYAKGRQIAINPLAQMPAKTTFHELAHIELGHTSEAIHDSETTPRSLREVEAESVALLCLESLGIDGAEFCRGYIQNWLAGAEIPERSAQRIFAAADKILKAGIERHDAQEVQ